MLKLKTFATLALIALSGSASAQIYYQFPTTASALSSKRSCIDAGASDAYACSLPDVPPSAYPTNFEACFDANTANVGNATIAFNGLAAKNITKVQGGVATVLADNDIRAGQWVCVKYDGTQFQMLSQLGNAAAGGGGITDASTTYTGGTASGLIFNDAGVVATDPGLTLNKTSRTLTWSAGTLVGAVNAVTMSATGNVSGNSGIDFTLTPAGGTNGNFYALAGRLATGYTSGQINVNNAGVLGENSGTGSGGNYKYGVIGHANGNAGSLFQIGVGGFATPVNGSSGQVVGVYGSGYAGSGTPTRSTGVMGLGNSNATNAAGGYFTLATLTGPNAVLPAPTGISALSADNGSVATPIAIFRDNGAASPTTGPTATVSILDGANIQAGNTVLTTATMTATRQGVLGSAWHAYSWSNAQVTALGAVLSGNITAVTLPAKTVVENMYVVITGAAAGTTTLTVSCGRTSASYIDYIVASNAQAAANTVYGDASGERGTNLTGYDLPSYTGTTNVVCQFTSTGANLSAVTGSTGLVILKTALVP